MTKEVRKEVVKAVGKSALRVGQALGFGVTMWLILHGPSPWIQLIGCINLGIYYAILAARFDFLERTNDLSNRAFDLLVKIIEKTEKSIPAKDPDPENKNPNP